MIYLVLAKAGTRPPFAEAGNNTPQEKSSESLS
jgi:hypothetical protein